MIRHPGDVIRNVIMKVVLGDSSISITREESSELLKTARGTVDGRTARRTGIFATRARCGFAVAKRDGGHGVMLRTIWSKTVEERPSNFAAISLN